MGFRDRLKQILVAVPVLHDLTSMVRTRRSVFGRAYEEPELWGSSESASGRGSELAATDALRAWLPDLFKQLGVTSVLDAPCGDWNWMQHVDLTGINYTGADIVESVVAQNQKAFARDGVTFMAADLTRDPLPRADLIMCRDCTIHLSFRDIGSIIENFRSSGADWLLMTTSPEVAKNVDQMTGLRWRALNMRLAPFNFPPSTEFVDDNYPDEHLQTTLWRLADIPSQRH